MNFMVKARAAELGATSTWADGTVRQKIAPGKWVPVDTGASAARAMADKRAESYYDQAIANSYGGLALLEYLEDKHNISTFADLKATIAGSPSDTAHKIFKGAKDYVDSMSIPTKLKQTTADRFGRSLLQLRDAYAVEKTKLTVKVQTKTGKTRYEPKKAPQASFAPTKITAARKKLAGWTDMKSLPSGKQIKDMISNKTAKVTYGKPDTRRQWEVKQGLSEVAVPFKGGAKGVTVSLRQSKKVKQRTSRTAEVSVTIPYPYARQFIEAHIKSKRTRNNLIGQLTRSAGYKKATT